MNDQELDDETYVRQFGFREFSGVRKNWLYRVITVGWFNLVETVRRSGFTKMLLIFMFVNLLIQDAVIVLITSFIPPEIIGITLDEIFKGVYVESVLGMVSILNRITDPALSAISFISIISGGTSLMWLLLIAILGGGLIADDRLNKTTEAYFSRISRFEYILGKLLSLVIFSAIVLTLPAVIQYFILSFSLKTDFFANIGLLFWSIGFTMIAVIIVSTLTLAISSLTTRRTVATMALIIIGVVTSALPSSFGFLYNPDTPFLLIDFIGAIALLGAILSGYSTVEINYRSLGFYNGVGLEAGMVIGMVTLVFVISLLVLFNVLFRRDN